MDYYQILQVASNASAFEIRNAYRRLALEWHPDKHPQNQDEATKKFKKISQAYQVLSDDNRRREYNQSIQKGQENSRSNHRFGFNFDFRSAEELFQTFFGGAFTADHGLDDLNDLLWNAQDSFNFFQVPSMTFSATPVNGHNVTQIEIDSSGGTTTICNSNVTFLPSGYSMASNTLNGHTGTQVENNREQEQTVQFFEDGVFSWNDDEDGLSLSGCSDDDDDDGDTTSTSDDDLSN